jgi:hypothetical protein
MPRLKLAVTKTSKAVALMRTELKSHSIYAFKWVINITSLVANECQKCFMYGVVLQRIISSVLMASVHENATVNNGFI